jgi:hypothetical protein
MKWFFKWALRLVLVLAALVILGLLFKDSILRVVVEHRIRSRTGMAVRIGKFSSGVFSSVVSIQDLRLYNTAQFGGTPFLDVPELRLEFDPVALRQRKLHVTLMRFNLNELDVVRNEAGQTNVASILRTVQARGSGDGEAGAQKLLHNFQFTGVDTLDLTLGKTKYVDLKDARNNRETNVNLRNQIFKNVKSDSDVYAILFLIWLRSRGSFAFTPAHTAGDLKNSFPIAH